MTLECFQEKAAKLLKINLEIDRDALVALMRTERITSFTEGLKQYEDRYYGTWTTNNAFVLDYLKDIDLLDKIPKEILPFVNLDKYSDMLIESNTIVYLQDSMMVRVFWT